MSQMGNSKLHRQYFDADVTSFNVVLIPYSIRSDKLCLTAFLSSDLLGHEKETEPKYKFPGGDGQSHEIPPETGRREFSEEVLRPNSKVALDFETAGAVLVHTKRVNDDSGRGVHLKMAYAFPENRLTNWNNAGLFYRTDLLEEKRVEGKGGGIVYPPQPIVIDTLAQLFRLTKTWFHREALAKFVQHIARNQYDLTKYIPTNLMSWAESQDPFLRPRD